MLLVCSAVVIVAMCVCGVVLIYGHSVGDCMAGNLNLLKSLQSFSFFMFLKKVGGEINFGFFLIRVGYEVHH